jgi:prepilin-type N-terminal cleavage/methylation domain-containing protein
MTHRRQGFSLIEVMVAMTLLSIVMMSLAKIGVTVAVRGRTSDLVAKRNAVLQLETNKIGTVPFDSLTRAPWVSGSKTFTLGAFAYTRRLSITKLSFTRDSIKVVIIPSLDSTKKDSVILDRTKPPAGTPLCVGC